MAPGDIVVAVMVGPSGLAPEDVAAFAQNCRRLDVTLMVLTWGTNVGVNGAATSSVPGPTVVQAGEYLRQGGPENAAQFLRFVIDRITGSTFGFRPPRVRSAR